MQISKVWFNYIHRLNIYDEIMIKAEDGLLACISFEEGTWCYTEEFITLADWRDKQIDKILEDD